jgi:hypothetical protein
LIVRAPRARAEKTAAESRAANVPPALATERSDAPTTDQANPHAAKDATPAARVNASAPLATLSRVVATGEITRLLLVAPRLPALRNAPWPNPSHCRMPTLATTIWTTMTTSPSWTSQRSLPRVPLPNVPRPNVPGPTDRRRVESARQPGANARNRAVNALTHVVKARVRVVNGRRLAVNAPARVVIDRRAAHQVRATSKLPHVPPAMNETDPRGNNRLEAGNLAAESKRPVASGRPVQNKRLAESKLPVASNARPRGRRVASASGRANPLALNHVAMNRAAANLDGRAVRKAAPRAMRTAPRVRKAAPRVTRIVLPAIVRNPNRPRLGLPNPSRQPRNRLPKSLPLGRLARNRPRQSPRSLPRRPLTVRSPPSPAWA